MGSGEFIKSGHLGGFVSGGDPASLYPDLWRWLVEGPIKARYVLDVGCGDGAALRAFEALGAHALGIDGFPQRNLHVIVHDFTTGPCPADLGVVDLVWSCEFVEHVEEQYIPNFLEAFAVAPLVLMTHALPGQPGWHHVNCKSTAYWKGVMEAIGYRLDPGLTAKTRELAALNPHPENYYVRSGLAFRRAT